MKKIVSKYEGEKIKRRNQFIIGGILILVMIFSVLGFAFQNNNATGSTNNSTQTINFNGITFTNQNGYWVVGYNNSQLIFTYNPSELNPSDLTNLTMNISDFASKPVYIYSEDVNAQSEIEINLAKFVSIINPIQNLSEQNCQYNTIIIQNGSLGVQQQQNCVIISGQGTSLISLVDNVLFKMFGIRQ